MLPFIIAGAAIATGVAGIGAGLDGKEDMKKAQAIADNAKRKYDKTQKSFKSSFEEVNRLANIYGQLQLRVRLNTIKRFISILERLEQNSSQDMKYFKELGITEHKIRELKTTVIEAENLVNSGTFAAAASGAGFAYGAAQAFGTATVTRFFGLWTTEVAVSNLAGAAAWQGMMAWLGGGSVAVGGLAFGGITLAPAIAIGGFKMAADGEKALTKAYEYESEIAVEIGKMEVAQEFLAAVYERTRELGKLVHRLESLANNILDEIDPPSYLYPGDIYRKMYGQQLHQSILIIKALADILKTPILNKEGNELTTESFTIYEKYSTID